MLFENKLEKIRVRYNEVSEKLLTSTNVQENIELSKEYSNLEKVIGNIQEYENIKQSLAQIEDLLATETDHEMIEIATIERQELENKLIDIEHKIKISLLPQDEAEEKNAIIEIRAGSGGEEAALFAYELLHMYQKHSIIQGWKFEILKIHDTGIGGYKEAIALISGKRAFGRLQFESGVHRVQRVPATESSGRIHTSAATVAVLPEVEEIDMSIAPEDLLIRTTRASGAGGQHVNTTDSAVSITHIPSGIVVTQQDERSQHKNKAKAMKILMARLYNMKREAKDKARAMERKEQVGSGDRSERIRTYNFPQGRVTDHRINMVLYKIHAILAGDLDELINALVADHEAAKLAREL